MRIGFGAASASPAAEMSGPASAWGTALLVSARADGLRLVRAGGGAATLRAIGPAPCTAELETLRRLAINRVPFLDASSKGFLELGIES
jgi:hypothetical protein